MIFERLIVGLLHGFKKREEAERPCFWCGVLTTFRDAEDFRVCPSCQTEEISVGYSAMKSKYPLAGTDARNPTFFQRH